MWPAVLKAARISILTSETPAEDTETGTKAPVVSTILFSKAPALDCMAGVTFFLKN